MIEVQSLSVDLGGRTILHEVDFRVELGTTTAIIGPNGSGKTTLIRAMCGMLTRASGRVRVGRSDIGEIDPKALARMIAVLRQESDLGFEFTVRELVALGRSPHKGLLDFEDDRDRSIIEDSLRMTDTLQLATRLFATLSGGEKQRVLLARALAQQPEVLLLDEPTNHLDIAHQLDLMARIDELGLTVVAALHDLNLARRFARRAVCLVEGRVHASGPIAEVLVAPVIESAFGVGVELLERAEGPPVFAFDPHAIDRPAEPG